MCDKENGSPTIDSRCDRIPSSPSSISSGEMLSIPMEESDTHHVFDYTDPNSFSAITRAVLSNNLEKLKLLVSKGNNLRSVDNNGDTALHHATRTFTRKNMDILKYLLTIEDIDLNATNHIGITPLLTSLEDKNEVAGLLLIEAGADINIASNEYVTPLHYAVRFSSKLTEALILRGADINAIDDNIDTPLHDAVSASSSEIVPMLLYYNADANITNEEGVTAFMLSLADCNTQLADELFEYVNDFNRVDCRNFSTLHLALLCNYSRIKEMIERGADVNYHGNKECNLFLNGLPLEIDTFRCVWKHFNYKHGLGTVWPHVLIALLNNMSFSNEYKLQAVDIILCCENTKKMLRLTKESDKYPLIHPFVNRLYKMGVSNEDAHKYCAILVSYGLSVYDIDLDMVYERYGYCKLFKLLLHMDIQESGVDTFNIFPYIIYQMRGDFQFLKRILDRRFYTSNNHSLDNVDYEHLLNHTANFQLMRWFETEGIDPICYKLYEYIGAYPQVPKLQELAIYTVRDFLRTRYNIKNSCQFYTTLEHLHISNCLKQLIGFEIPLYIEHSHNMISMRSWIKECREGFINSFDDTYYRTYPFSQHVVMVRE